MSLKYKLSNTQYEGLLKSLKNQGFDVDSINVDELRNDGVLSSNDRTFSSYKFKDKNGNRFTVSMSFKSDVKGVSIGDYSDEMNEMKRYFDKGKKKFGELTETKVEMSGSVS